MEQRFRAVRALDLALALLENADSLLGDATVLLEAGRPPRAIALSLIAAEELGKIYLCLEAISGVGEIPGATSREWRDHRDKLVTARALDLAFFDDPTGFDIDAASAEVELQLQMKMSTLYLDHRDGVILRPSEVAGDPGALIARGQTKSVLLHSILDRVTPEVLAAMREHGEAMSQITQALIDENDPAGTARRLRSIRRPQPSTTRMPLRLALANALGSAPTPPAEA